MVLIISRMVARLLTLVLAAYWVLLLLGTHLPAGGIPSVQVSDKALHVVAYTGLAFLLATAVTAYRWPTGKTYAAMAACLLVYGAIDELAQIPIPSRTADFRDWIADGIGIGLGLLAHNVAVVLYQRFCSLEYKKRMPK